MNIPKWDCLMDWNNSGNSETQVDGKMCHKMHYSIHFYSLNYYIFYSRYYQMQFVYQMWES